MIERVMFVSRIAAENTPGWADWAVISINDPFAALGEARLMPGWHAIYTCAFHDVDPANPSAEIDEFLICMNDEQAQGIINFMREVAPHVQGVLVHCNSGVSRSAAVAKWIAENFSLPFNIRYDKYNQHVYQCLVTAGEARISSG